MVIHSGLVLVHAKWKLARPPRLTHWLTSAVIPLRFHPAGGWTRLHELLPADMLPALWVLLCLPLLNPFIVYETSVAASGKYEWERASGF